MTTSTTPDKSVPPAPADAERFQFRIRDLLLITALIGLLVASVAQQNGLLFLAFICASGLCLTFVWRKITSTQLVGLVGTSGLLLGCAGAFQEPRGPGRRVSCGNNLKQIVLALHDYHDMYGTLPPAYIADKNGKPMHSWRVLILPFIEHKPLYDKYRFDEPWDGPNNSLLADKIGRIYSCPSHAPTGGKRIETNYVAIVGAHTPWPGSKGRSFPVFKDGTPNVILVVEVHNSGIHWMEPRDLHVSQMAPTINPKHGQGISSAHPGGAQVGLADGSIRFLPDETPQDVLRSHIIIDDGTFPLPQ